MPLRGPRSILVKHLEFGVNPALCDLEWVIQPLAPQFPHLYHEGDSISLLEVL